MMATVARSFILLHASWLLSLGVEHLDAREPRVVFNDETRREDEIVVASSGIET